MKLENANNLIKGNEIKMIETTYDFAGNKVKEYEHKLIVTKINKNSVSIDDLTYNISYNLLKNYQFGKINCGIKKEYYLI